MFRAILPVLRIGSTVSVRTYRRSGNRKPRDMAGVRIQQGIFGNADAPDYDPEVTYEADFNQLGSSHRDHVNEMELRKEQIKYYTVRSRYFKTEKLPNFLTWAEKEQIRHLNKDEPLEWTPERLAESFPANEEVIIKVLKAKWTPSNMKRVQKHDESVKRNWESFKAKEMQHLDPEFYKHLEKFSNRNFDNIQNAYIQTNNDQIEFQFPKPKSQEFLHIISSCKRVETKPKELADNKSAKQQIVGEKTVQKNLPANEVKKEELMLSKRKQKETMTYEELVKSAKNLTRPKEDDDMHLSVSLLKEPSAEVMEKKFVSETHMKEEKEATAEWSPHETTYPNESEDSNVVSLKLSDIETEEISKMDEAISKGDAKFKKISKYQSKQVSVAKLPTSKAILFRNRIAIPKQLQKQGSVYKLDDCFYDDRGQFLYRVPGLSN